MNIANHYKGRKVLVTGHTGFKGSWLVLWLQKLGAQITGLSIDIPTQPSMFEALNIAELCDHKIGDINDLPVLTELVKTGDFDTVFHLAAQPLVRLSYQEPLSTLTTNVIGTANVLEAVRLAARSCNIVAVTSDKCYQNSGTKGLRETDPMGGADPYSMSKGAAELVISSWRQSFFSEPDSPVRLASARAGNVIGGGDWALDRIVPDCVAALQKNQPVQLRNPHATRPWQHVVEPLSGYLLLGALLDTNPPGAGIDEAWNFGPAQADVRSVQALVDCLITNWGRGEWQDASTQNAPKEAATLALNCDKAATRLNWHPVWPFERSIAETVRWYRAFQADDAQAIRQITLDQIQTYSAQSPVFASAETALD